MTNFHKISTTDPITGRDISDLEGRPFVVEGGHYNNVTIYFESEQNKQAYLDIPLQGQGGEGRLHSLLDNPVNDMNDFN